MNAQRWIRTPGGWDALKTERLQPGTGRFGIPVIERETGIPDWMVPYNEWFRQARHRQLPTSGSGCVHFFIDDYRMERCWNQPDRAVRRMPGASFVLSPDFSLYRDWPPAVQVWNVYRSRWLGAFWRTRGLRVIPTVGWADWQSWEFCFDGLPADSSLAVSTVGVARGGEALEIFASGYREMCRRLHPSTVLVYGEKFPPELRDCAPLQQYQPWQLRFRGLGGPEPRGEASVRV